jgi:MFS family permease
VAAVPHVRRLPTGIAFWTVAVIYGGLMVAASAPSPLYVVYQQRWHVSASVLTVVFAAYAVALLAALVTVGGLSDYVGRRPVLLAALALEVVAMTVFLLAGDVGTLLAARVLQGLATGAAMGTISAALIDLQPPDRPGLGALVNGIAPLLGLAAGALGAGLLVQYAPAPTTLVFVLLDGAFLLVVGSVLLLPETVRPRPGALASLAPRVAVPRRARRTYQGAIPAMVAAWALGGLYLSLGPSLAAGPLGVRNHLVGGFVIATMMAPAALATWAARDVTPVRMMTGGCLALAAGVTVTLLGLTAGSLVLFLVGTALAGVGFGPGFLGAFRNLAALTTPQDRAQLFAALFVVSYLAFSVPAVVAGLLVGQEGLRATADGYGLVVVVLALAGALGSRRATGRVAVEAA